MQAIHAVALTLVCSALPDPANAGLTTTARARAYLDVNCAMCHRPGGTTPVSLDLRYGVPVEQMNAIDVLATNPVFGDPTRRRVMAGSKALGDLWERMRLRDSRAMPPLASRIADPAAWGFVGAWIDGGARNRSRSCSRVALRSRNEVAFTNAANPVRVPPASAPTRPHRARR